MSVAERSAVERPSAAVPVRRAHPGAGLRLLRSELGLIFGRRRNLAGLAVLAAVPILIAVAVKTTLSQPQSGAPDFFGSITSNGLFVALAALTIELPLFLPLAVSVIAGDSVAGEANMGTLRYLLTIPVHRTRLLAHKMAAIAIFAFVATLLVAVVGGIIGVALFGGGQLTLLSGTQIGMGQAMWRVFLAVVYLAWCLTSLGAIGLFISTLTEQPIGAAIAIIILNVLSFIIDSIPQVAWMHPYLPTHWWTTFGDLLRAPISWGGPLHGAGVAAAYLLVFWLAAWARFSGKDITS
ncbi:MAG TPA: ABC transporter permease [Segeticoccus sp.]|uniref:ABC transporter permease n=1 Tax=Segeticoccus sp. TaxID=2706531 RepID=UPI002D7F94C9|nr:ABC transporter permease [Segeticoccus sp.]HET8598785.1 ABC transporter permease [Segeticoccus sp.]